MSEMIHLSVPARDYAADIHVAKVSDNLLDCRARAQAAKLDFSHARATIQKIVGQVLC